MTALQTRWRLTRAGRLAAAQGRKYAIAAASFQMVHLVLTTLAVRGHVRGAAMRGGQVELQRQRLRGV